MKIRAWLATTLALICLFPGTADARMVALIIGNSDYANTSPLTNPANDIQIIAASAHQAGFDDVTVASDLSVNEFQLAMRDFRAKSDGADVALVYFAGHGIEAQGKNWLIPVDAELKADLDLPYEAINLDRVLESVSGAQIRIVILDACRNNPFGRTWRSGTRAVAHGMASVDADDVLVIYAAAPGQTASDGKGTNSPFALSLAKRLPQPDLPVQLLGGSIRDDVLAATGGNQRPFVSASITGTPVYLVPRVKLVTAPPPAVPSGNRTALEDIMWKGALAENNVRAFSAYLSEFPGGRFAAKAGANISRLLQSPVSTSSVATTIANMSAPAAPSDAAAVSRKYILSNLRIECLRVTGNIRLGFPDQLFLRFNTGERVPAGKRDVYKVKKGDSWLLEQPFEFDQPASFQIKEFDDIGGSDLIGTIYVGETAGSFTKMLDGDNSDYRVTYTLAVK